jgi:GNAT superfamily N-acetyltransferase
MQVHRIRAAETRPLRQSVLRPTARVEDLAWAHDDDAETYHAGIFEDGQLVAIGTIHPAPPPAEHFASDSHRESAWRLRGMATSPGHRGRGHGALIVRACIEHARAHAGTLLWCTARVPAVAFYERLGFRKHGDVFEGPHVGPGPHFVMSFVLG